MYVYKHTVFILRKSFILVRVMVFNIPSIQSVPFGLKWFIEFSKIWMKIKNTIFSEWWCLSRDFSEAPVWAEDCRGSRTGPSVREPTWRCGFCYYCDSWGDEANVPDCRDQNDQQQRRETWYHHCQGERAVPHRRATVDTVHTVQMAFQPLFTLRYWFIQDA